LIRKEISILISAVLIVALMTSSFVSSVDVTGAPGRNGENFLYSVSISPTVVRVNQGDFGTYNVQVSRGSDEGQLSILLSLDAASSNLLKTAVTLNPTVLNFEQGQNTANATLKINSQELELGSSTSFRVQAAILGSAAPDHALSNPAALIVRAAETRQSSNSQTDLESQQSLSSQSLPSNLQQEKNPAPKLNTAPIARAGPDQTVNEGQRVILDGSSSTDADNDNLLLSWEQFSPRNPSVELVSSETSYKASFAAPIVDRDTIFRLKLVTKDGNGGLSSDSINILIKNVEEQHREETVPRSDLGTVVAPNLGETSTENHSPTVNIMQVLTTEQDKPLSISLKGNDPDKDDKITYIILTNPSHGTVAGFDKTSGSMMYLPSSGYIGQDRLSYRALDIHDSASNEGQVVIRVNAPRQSAASPTLPAPVNLSSSTSEEGSFTGSTTSSSSSPTPKSNENTTTGSTSDKGTKTNANASSVLRNAPKSDGNTTALFASGKGTNAKTNTSAVGINDTKLASANATQQNETQRSFAASSIAAGELYRFVKDWGGFSSPHALDVDSSGNVYVVDTNNNLVKVFNANGTFIRQWGGAGSTNGKFNSPQGISVQKSSGNVYVVDTGNNRVQKFSPAGTFLLSWGGKGSGNGQFDTPASIDHDSLGNSYVADANNKRIVKSLDSQFITKWSGAGAGQGQLKGPHGITVDSGNNVYVVDSTNNELLKFTSSGTFIKSIGGLPTSSADGKFNLPHGVGADSQDSIFVTDRGNNRVQKFDAALSFLTKFGSGPGTTPGVFNGPDGIAISSSGKVYVIDVGNNKVQLWRPAPSISITANTTQLKWDRAVKVTGTVTNFDPTDKVSVEWGDGTPATLVTPISQSGSFEVAHVYGISSTSTNPNNLVAKVQSSSGGEELAVSQTIIVTVQKHATSLTLQLKPNEAPQCANCPIYVIGSLNDTDSIRQNNGVKGKAITLSGSGVSNLANPVQTGGLIFSGSPLTLTSSALQMPAGSEIILPTGTHGVALQFNQVVDVTFTTGNDAIINPTPDSASPELDHADGLKKITIGSPGELKTLFTRDVAATEDNQIAVDFSKKVAAPGQYATLPVSNGTYFSGGVTQTQDGSGLKVVAAFNAASDSAYLGATSPELSYDVSRAAGVGEGIVTAYSGVVWTKLTVGGTNVDGDMCTSVIGGVKTPSGDADADGICDKFEAPPGSNDATFNAFIACPTTLSGTVTVAIDPQCANTNGSIKYNLCFNDQFASAWTGNTDGKRVCPKQGHKDMFVEIDYMSGRQPSANAIKNVIRAFGNAPFANSQPDSFNRGTINGLAHGGITLHVVVSDQFARVAPFNVWTDTTPGLNDFRGVKEANFGTAAERGGTSGMPGMTASAWSSTGDVLKHYVYHYGQWVTYYGGACTDGTDADTLVDGLSSGLAELLGNDFIVSLGCGFGGGVDTSGNSATRLGSLGTDDEQAGTLMHELGHNLNLAHGGPATLAITSVNYNMNCKPNYLSVMNYARQLPNAVLDQASWEAGFNYVGPGAQTSLDYARSTLPNLPEGAAPEATNIASSDGKQYWIVYGTPTKSPAVRKVLSGTSIDFDGSGAKAGTVSADLNVLSPTIAGCGPFATPTTFPLTPDLPQTLTSHSDWDKVNLVFSNDGDSQDGVTTRVSLPFINKNTQELKPIFLQSVASDIKVLFIPPPEPDGSSKFNTGSTVPLKFQLKDKNGNFITNAVVKLVAEKGSTTIVGSTPFSFGNGHYQYNWLSPSGASGKGEWTLKYILNYQSTNPALPQSVLPGPFATDQYTLKITGVK
jgi:NHL repeat/6-bladed beta-propeller